MAVQTRTPTDIVTTMLNVFSAVVDPKADRNPGSRLRTFFEACALIDSEQYVQIVKAFTSFYLDTATGDDLDRRLRDFNLPRILPAAALTNVVLGDTTVVTPVSDTLSAGVSNGVSVITPTTIANWPASGYVILDRQTGSLRERIAFTKSGGNLNLTTPTAFSHATGSPLNLSVQGSDRTIPAGTKLLVPSTAVSSQVVFSTQADATIYDGDRNSASVLAKCDVTGAAFNIVPNRLSQFQTQPFTTAIIVSNDQGVGGADRESDTAYRARGKGYIRGISNATISALTAKTPGITKGNSTVANAQLVESTTPGIATLYIDDGSSTGIIPTVVTVPGYEVILAPSAVAAGNKRGRIANAPINNVGADVHLYKSPSGAAYKGLGTIPVANQIQIAGQTWTTNQFTGWVVVDGSGTPWPVVSNTVNTLTLGASAAPAAGPCALFDPSPAAQETLPGASWSLNLSTGDIQWNGNSGNGFDQYDVVLTWQPGYNLGGWPGANVPVVTGTRIVIGAHVYKCTTAGTTFNGAQPAFNTGTGSTTTDGTVVWTEVGLTDAYAYRYRGGIIQEVQKKVNGSLADVVNYPGLKAVGSQITVTVPSVTNVSFNISVVPISGVSLTSLILPVQQAVIQYVNSLAPGQTVLLVQILTRVLAVTGVQNVSITSPTADIGVADGSVAKTSTALLSVV